MHGMISEFTFGGEFQIQSLSGGPNNTDTNLLFLSEAACCEHDARQN